MARLLAAAGGESSDAAAVCGDGAKDCRLAGGDGLDGGVQRESNDRAVRAGEVSHETYWKGGVIPVLVEFTVPANSGVTVPLKSPASSCAVGTFARVFCGCANLQPSYARRWWPRALRPRRSRPISPPWAATPCRAFCMAAPCRPRTSRPSGWVEPPYRRRSLVCPKGADYQWGKDPL